MKAEAASCSIEEDVVTVANDSLCSESIASAGDEKGTEQQAQSVGSRIHLVIRS